MARKLILADGTEYDNSGCGEAGGKLFCNIQGEYNLVSVIQKFINAENTQTIIFEAGDIIDTFTGYTEIVGASQIEKSLITVTLRKPGGE